MKHTINMNVYKVMILLFAILPISCNALVKETESIPVINQIETTSSTVEISAKASETPIPTETKTPLPTFVIPPTPAPPASEYMVFVSSHSSLSFQYPANWFVYSEDKSSISITNFRLDGMALKGHDEEKVKIDVMLDTIDISDYVSLKAYLDAPSQQPSDDDPGKILNQIELVHALEGYEVIRQTFSGFMGQVDETYEKIYIASDGKAVRILVFSKQYINVAEEITRTLTIP